MAFQCTFAGVTFRPPTPAALAWLAQTGRATLRDVMPFTPAWPGPRFTSMGLADPPPVPGAGLGDYFYPAGASRWSVFRGLASAADVTAMQASAWASAPTACSFVLQCEGGDSAGALTTNLYLLPPVPAGGLNGTPALYVVTLVDERYFWHQWQSGGVVTCTSATATWTGLLNQLASQLGITLSFTTPSANYGSPEPDSALYTNYESPAVLLDAAAANVGCAVVRNLDGTYKLQSYATAQTARDANRPTTGNNLAGGYSLAKGGRGTRAVLPASVTVVFPKWVDGSGYYEPTTYRGHVLDSYGAAYAVTVAASGLGSPYSGYATFPGAKVLHTTAKARFTLAGDTDPNNLTTCQSLANQLAQDYYDSRLAFLDESYPGVRPWVPEGASDVLYCWQGDTAYTRVLPPPFNLGASEFQHGFGALTGGTYSFTTKEQDGSPSSTTGLQWPNTALDTTGTDALVRAADTTHYGLVSTSNQKFGAGVKAVDALGLVTNFPFPAAGTVGDNARFLFDGTYVHVKQPNPIAVPLPLVIGSGSGGGSVGTLLQVTSVDGSGLPTGYFQQENIGSGPSYWRLNHTETVGPASHPEVIYASGAAGGPGGAAQTGYRFGCLGKIIAGTKFAVGDVGGVTDGVSSGSIVGGILTTAPGTGTAFLNDQGVWASPTSNLTVGTSTITSGTDGNFVYQSSGKVAEYTPAQAGAAIGTAMNGITGTFS